MMLLRKKNFNIKKYGTEKKEMYFMAKEIKIDITRGENGRICVLKKKANNVKWKS